MNDDLDEEIIGADDGFDEFSQKSNLGDAIQQNPAVKIGVVVAAVVVIVGVAFMFGGEGTTERQSSMPAGSDVTSVPGTSEEVDPAYIEAVEQQNEEDLDLAIREGRSTIPVPIETPTTRLELPEVQEENEDPLHRWRQLQEERVQREMKRKEVDVEPVTVLNAEQQNESIKKLSQSMVQQMQSVLGANNQKNRFKTNTYISYDEEGGDGNGGSGSRGASNGGGRGGINGFTAENEEEVIIPAGNIYYGQTMLQANSDVPNVVLVRVVSGPLKGWKLLGSFQVMSDVEMLAITFNTAVNDEGKQLQISAVMLDPSTSLPAMRTDVDHRYMRRILLPAAAAFIEGYAEAFGETEESVIIVGDTVVTTEEETTTEQEVSLGIEEMASDISDIIDDIADVPVRIVIDAGTPIGIFFTQNVTDKDSDI
ncbi:MAG: hypothetical protein ACRBDL_06520 [Alphaproteobacteria bacterium]